MGVAERILRASDVKVISYFVRCYGPYDAKNEEVTWAQGWVSSLRGGPCRKDEVVVPWLFLCLPP